MVFKDRKYENAGIYSSPWELSGFMQVYGEVSKCYVAKKRDKFDNHFGFISFKAIRNWKDLEKRMNGINMGGNTLKVNVAWFAVENNGLDREKERNSQLAGLPHK
ncbi:putative RNA recognition motif domain, nucleotide-binding alpha-beta plait domain superfamily [Helianthus anomalus]